MSVSLNYIFKATKVISQNCQNLAAGENYNMSKKFAHNSSLFRDQRWMKD